MEKILSIIVLLLLLSCAAIRYRRDSLKMKRQNYNGQAIHLNGFYRYQDNRISSSFFLYRNGIYFCGNGLNLPSIGSGVEMNQYIKALPPNHLAFVDIVYWWGLFEVDSSNITIESWMSDNGLNAYPTRTFHGTILNDTTIIMKNYCSNGQDTFRFYETSVKPDSTNKFIP
jgi:hypothetical protein